MKIMAFESSAKAASVAVLSEGNLIGENFTASARTHSETLLPMAEALLASLKLQVSDIDAFAVSAGPGSFTGLRIGIATIKGMMAAMGQTCAPVSTLEAMAYNFDEVEGVLCAVMDARVGQVYNALFYVKEGQIIRLCGDRALKIEELEEELLRRGEPVTLCGDGAALCQNKMTKISAKIASPLTCMQRASGVARLAATLPSENFVTGSELAPVYLRLPQAERERLAKNNIENKPELSGKE